MPNRGQRGAELRGGDVCGVQGGQHCRCRSVVRFSHPGAALLAVLLLSGVARDAAAQDEPLLGPRAPAPATALPPPESYRGWLAASYVFAPFAALAAGSALATLTQDDTLATLGSGTLLLAPAAVHAAHGNAAHGGLSLLGLAGATGASVLAGAGLGFALDYAACDTHADAGCGGRVDGMLIGAMLGGLAGYAGFAIYDV